MDIEERAKKIKCILSDVDGTLTDGRFFLFKKESLKQFNIKDVLGISFLRHCGLKFGILTGDISPDTKRFARNTGASFLYQGCGNKAVALREILDTAGFQLKEIAYIGDDLNDIPVFQKVGLAVVVKNSVSILDEYTHYRTKTSGGDGALRELVEIVLKANGMWKDILRSYQEK